MSLRLYDYELDENGYKVRLALGALGLDCETVAVDMVPGAEQTRSPLIDLNPLTGLLEACRWMTISRYSPSVLAIGISLAMTLLLLIGGWHVFTRLETTMADEI